MIPLTVGCQAPPSREFFRQEYWNRLSFPPPRDLPNPGIKPRSLASPALAGRFFTTEPLREAEYTMRNAGLDEAQVRRKIAGRNINNLRYADDITLMAESEEELPRSVGAQYATGDHNS